MTCPICRKAAPTADYRPFCSRRCADIDLGKWLTGSYAIPADDDPEHSPDLPHEPGGETPEKPH
jgi:hypothetical protein